MKAPLDAPPLTTVSAGTWTAGLLLESWTTAPSVARVKRSVPVAPPPPTTLVGVTDTEDSCAPAGVAALTDRFAVRGTLPTAAMICTISSGAAALVEIVKSTEIAPAGTVAVAGTVATFGSLLNSSTVVGAGSGNASETVPVADAPSRTWLGLIESDEIIPAADAAAGRANETISTARAAARRRI